MSTSLRLNTLKSKGARSARKRVGRGIGSGDGKTCGRGVKGQRSRSGGYHKVGFEGGQMPLQRRVPKFGFHSITAAYGAEVRLHELEKVTAEVVDLLGLKQAGVIGHHVKRVKVIASGVINKAVVLKGLKCTKGAKAAIESAGGKVEE